MKHADEKWEVRVNHLPSADYARNLIYCDNIMVASTMSSCVSKDDQESRALMVAALPDLLDACVIASSLRHGHDKRCKCADCLVITVLKQAIAKAENKQPETHTVCRACNDAGFILSNRDSSGEHYIEKCDSCDLFLTDTQAVRAAYDLAVFELK